MLIEKVIEGFILARTASGYSPHTIAGYKYFLGYLVQHFGNIEMGAVTTTELRQWLASLDLSPISKRNAWSVMRALFGWSASELQTPRPDLLISMPIAQPAAVHPFSENEIVKLLAACERTANTNQRRPSALRDRALVLTLLDTGLRVSELARLRLSDVNIENGEIVVKPFMSGRKSRGRTVIIGKSARMAIWRYVASREVRPSDPLFISAHNHAMDRDTIRHLLVNLGERAHVTNVHPHRFRHTFAILSLRAGMDVFTLQRLLGHSTLEMVRHYLAIVDTDVSEAHRRASPVDNWRL